MHRAMQPSSLLRWEIYVVIHRYRGALRTGSSESSQLLPKSTVSSKSLSRQKMRSHTFEMAHNKQLKVVLRGLPTDYNQEELMSELHTLGFKPNHISLLRNRKTNTNMPLFLVTLVRNPENKGIFNIKTLIFRVSVERSINPLCPHSAIDVKNSFITLGFALEHRSV
ncbi:hypothetical protein TNCV_2162501 [Trichonephila clavipes]|nr:hypothetical protein TNCV_2162501 [Trichonephila clavipes]